MTKIFFDESGQTGAHLFDQDQRYFTLGSTDIPELEAAGIIKDCFPRVNGPELKSRSLFRRKSGRQAFMAFAEIVGHRSSNFCGAKIDKRFSIVCKMVDNLVEPMFEDMGHDFYADDYAARFANMAYYAFSNILDEQTATALLASYNTFARAPSVQTLAPLQSELKAALAFAPRGSENFLSLMATGAQNFERFQTLAKFRDTNDLHVTAAIRCMGFWQTRHPGSFDVIHDESTHFFKRSRMWEMMTNPHTEPTTLQVGDKILSLPISVHSTTASKSHECASLQLCDLIAGFINFVSSSVAQDDLAFARRALESGMDQLSIIPVEPGYDFVDGPPKAATGPDVIDRLIEAVHPNRSRDR
ncbi:DUF3800 domain-containing protein [Rhizobium sp. Root1204]|uniref:DUF3800 domain-containing protein n=1 Tax=Rhizobium sp. Root1204 TaxID=1736428 RepID=UPI0007138984|nr:DUF3800 domain-containing protein [Rhizobium sp. Root1204]KQV29393.1 hypothetical protein ASC96_12080 [Rhizobium sp. Root1204]